MEKLLRKAEAADALGVSVSTLGRLRSDPQFPKARQIRPRGVIGFLQSEIAAYLHSLPEADETAAKERVAPALKARGISTGSKQEAPDAGL